MCARVCACVCELSKRPYQCVHLIVINILSFQHIQCWLKVSYFMREISHHHLWPPDLIKDRKIYKSCYVLSRLDNSYMQQQQIAGWSLHDFLQGKVSHCSSQIVIVVMQARSYQVKSESNTNTYSLNIESANE